MRRFLLGAILACTSSYALAQSPVNINDKQSVTEFYRKYYCAVDRVDPNWTGDIIANKPGTTSDAYKQAALDRVYFLRGLAGIGNNITLSQSMTREAQKLAHLISANFLHRVNLYDVADIENRHPEPYKTVLHYYPSSTKSLRSSFASSGGSFGSSIINLTRGVLERNDVISSIDTYRKTDGYTREILALLNPGLTEIGIGGVAVHQTHTNQFGSENMLELNSNTLLYDQNFEASTSSEPTLWPPNGYVPHMLVGNTWSAYLPGADFRTAYLSINRVDEGAGDESIRTILRDYEDDTPIDTMTWKVNNNFVIGRKSNLLRSPTGEIHLKVTIGNILYNGSFRDINYTVKIFDPQPNTEGSRIEVSLPPKAEGTNRDVIEYKVFGADDCLIESDLSFSSEHNLALRLYRGPNPDGPFNEQAAFVVGQLNGDFIPSGVIHRSFKDGFYRFDLGVRTSRQQATDKILAQSEVLNYTKTFGFRKLDGQFSKIVPEKSLKEAFDNLENGIISPPPSEEEESIDTLNTKLRKLQKKRRKCRRKKRQNTCTTEKCIKRCKRIRQKIKALKQRIKNAQ